MNYFRIANALQSDPKVWAQLKRKKGGLIILLDKSSPNLYKGAGLINVGSESVEELPYDVTPHSYEGDAMSTGVEIIGEDGGTLAAFHTSRQKNGIGFLMEDLEYPFIAFMNDGRESITFIDKDTHDEDHLSPGEVRAFWEMDIDHPDVQDALKRLSTSPEVLAEIEEIRQEQKQKELEQERKDKEAQEHKGQEEV